MGAPPGFYTLVATISRVGEPHLDRSSHRFEQVTPASLGPVFEEVIVILLQTKLVI